MDKLEPFWRSNQDAPLSRAVTSLTRRDWIAAARDVLESRGIADVKVDRLAKGLKVTRGSFYFHFKNRKDLLDALLEEWRDSNCRPLEVMAKRPYFQGVKLFEALTDSWLPGGTFNAKLDMAVRDWARTSRAVEAKVQKADRRRIEILFAALRDMGFAQDEALVRARICYLHQIGYYAVHLTEPLETRLRYIPLYLKVITGRKIWKRWQAKSR